MTFFTATTDENEAFEYTITNWPPIHITSVTIQRDGDFTLLGHLIGCSCGWKGRYFDIGEGDVIDLMAEAFMEHKRLSAQVARRTKKFRKPPQ